jgi:hypothetical protein
MFAALPFFVTGCYVLQTPTVLGRPRSRNDYFRKPGQKSSFVVGKTSVGLVWTFEHTTLVLVLDFCISVIPGWYIL